MSEMVIAAYIFIFFLAAGLLFLACKLGILIQDVKKLLVDEEDKIGTIRSDVYFLKNTVNHLNNRVKILEDKKAKSKIALGKIKVGK